MSHPIPASLPASVTAVFGRGAVALTAVAVLASGLAAGAASAAGGGDAASAAGADGAASAARPPTANPYLGARMYVNPEWRAKALAEPGGDRVAHQPTAVWLDSIAAITGIPDSPTHRAMGLADHLDQAVVQAAGEPMVVQLVLYNLPGRNCGRLASNGELGPTELPRYRAEFVDPIARIIKRPAYRNLRIVTIIEPDSLPYLVTHTGDRFGATSLCDTMLANGGYVDGIGYALAKLSAIPNVYNYLDVAHHGAIGWEENLAPTMDLLVRAARASGSITANVRGFVTNTAGYSALREPYIPLVMPYIYSRWIDWNPFNEEFAFAQATRGRLVRAGFDPSVGFVVDTSRNGWGGPGRPTGPSTYPGVDDFVDASRIDRRLYKSNYCNQSGAGLGERPTAAPADGIHAYAWIKPPGESDGASSQILDENFNRMCDPEYNWWPGADTRMTGALPNAPAEGAWFSAQFQQLMANAHPPL